MKVYLAGLQGRRWIIPTTKGGYEVERVNNKSNMMIYLAGGVSGNLHSAWKQMAKTEITPSGLEKALVHERFLKDEDLSCVTTHNSQIRRERNGNIHGRKHDIPEVYCASDRECNCSLQGSLHGGVGGGTTR